MNDWTQLDNAGSEQEPEPSLGEQVLYGMVAGIVVYLLMVIILAHEVIG